MPRSASWPPPAAGWFSSQPLSSPRWRPSWHDHAGAGRLVSAGERPGDPASCPFYAPGACVAPEDAGSLAEDAAASCGLSFTASTKVLLASGAAIAISQLKPGDKVLATNTRTGKTQPETVAAVLINHDTDLYNLTIRAGTRTAVIHTTSSHPFWVPAAGGHGGRRVKAGALRYGTHLRTSAGGTATVLGGQTPKLATGWMWDLTIPGDHDFYIDTVAAPVLVHNCGSGGTGDEQLPLFDAEP